MQISNVLTIAGMVIGLGVYGIGIAMWAGEKNKTIEVQDASIRSLSEQIGALSGRVSVERDVNLARDVEELDVQIQKLEDSMYANFDLIYEEIEELDDTIDIIESQLE
jgi:hypothetical protein